MLQQTKNILFLSLDGMTDPLGQSQVLPYLQGLAEKGYGIFLISCEKKSRYAAGKSKIEDICRQAGIHWFPQPYLQQPRGIATVRQVRKMYREASRLHKEYIFFATHCRSYIPALVGLKLKRKKGIPFIFDMRGFWADERVEGGLWDVKKPVYRAAYRYMKRKEKAFLQEATHTVSLTEKGRQIIEDMALEACAPISVIPCSVDLDLFSGEKKSPRSTHALRFVYLGSLGSWYLLEEMLHFFHFIWKKRPEARLLILSQSPAEIVYQQAASIGLPLSALSVRTAPREKIPALLEAADIGLFFIKPCFSKQASSPTKLGEMLAMGLPVIANAGVGDLDTFFEKNQVGLLLQSFQESEYERIEQKIDELLSWDKQAIRRQAETFFSLEKAIKSYSQIYQLISKSAHQPISTSAHRHISTSSPHIN